MLESLEAQDIDMGEMTPVEITVMFQQIEDAPEAECEALHVYTSFQTGEGYKMPSECTHAVTHRFINSKLKLSLNVCQAFANDFQNYGMNKDVARIVKI